MKYLPVSQAVGWRLEEEKLYSLQPKAYNLKLYHYRAG